MFNLYDKDTKALIGSVGELEMHFLREQLEEEGLEDKDYAITALVLDVWEGEGDVPPGLVPMLRTALGERQEMNIEWKGA